MKTSPNGLRRLEQEEGRVLHVYLDSCKIPTVGVGHVVRPSDGLKLGDTINEDRCESLLAGDVGAEENAVNGALTVRVTQNQFDALISLAFNIGGGAIVHSTVIADLNAGNLGDEKRAFELWDKDTKNGKLVVDEELLARRDREFALFMTPDAPADGQVPYEEA